MMWKNTLYYYSTSPKKNIIAISIYQDAIMQSLEIIGEAVGKISDDSQEINAILKN